MDSHVAGVCAGPSRSPVPGPGPCTAQKQHLPLCAGGLAQALPCGLHPCRLRLVESYPGSQLGRSLLHPRQAWGSFARMTSFYLRSSSVTPSLGVAQKRSAWALWPCGGRVGDSDPSPWSETRLPREHVAPGGSLASALRRQSRARRLALRGDPYQCPSRGKGGSWECFPKRN